MTGPVRTLAVCWKWVVDPQLGADQPDRDRVDERWARISHADEAALEVALRLRRRGDTVVVVTTGPPAADADLRRALAAGADRAVRIEVSSDGGHSGVESVGLDSSGSARLLADTVGDADFILCGDYSLDRGSGSVPAFLAGLIGASQALGLVEVETETVTPVGTIRVVRRLDGGRREVLDVDAPAVLSVEGSVASLRRAGLVATLAAATAPVRTVTAGGDQPQVPPYESPGAHPPTVRPYRPRARAVPIPDGSTLDRVRAILDVGGAEPTHNETVVLDPPAAAQRILDQLGEWGYLDS
jgi:electron transfer flavoprotein beta subunit